MRFGTLLCIYICIYCVSLLVLASPPGKVGLYAAMSVIMLGAFPGERGIKRIVILGLCIVGLILVGVECKRGEVLKDRIDDIRMHRAR